MPDFLTCYACALPATSREHAPPRALFPEAKDLTPGLDLRRNLISVPSCDAHNSQTSKDDEYLMWLLSLPQANATKDAHFESKAMRAFRRRPATFVCLMANLTQVQLVDESGEVYETAAFEVDLQRFDRCMWKTAVALYYDETGKKWLGGSRVLSNVFVDLDGSDAEKHNAIREDNFSRMRAAFRDTPAKGENPEVFSYRLVESRDSAALLLTFYENIQVVVLLCDAPQESPANRIAGNAPPVAQSGFLPFHSDSSSDSVVETVVIDGPHDSTNRR